MNKTSKLLLTCVIAFAVCIHFVFVAVYCFPHNIKSNKFETAARLYVYPIFQQNWALFVPAPSVERKLFVRHKTDGAFSRWTDILSREIVRHKKNRLLGNEAIVLLLSNSLIYELNSLDGEPSAIYIGKQNSTEFKVLEFEVEQYLKSEYNMSRSNDYELLLVASKKDSQRSYYFQNLSIH